MGTTSMGGQHEDIPWVTTILIAQGAGLLGIIIYAWSDPGTAWTVLACALIISVAAAVAGALLGFVFGIPKTSATATATSEYQGNSNLEQISDWLTKILVGAGLVQLGAIPEALAALGKSFSETKTLGANGAIVGPALMVAYSVTGFLLAYLWARIYMAQALAGAVPATADEKSATAESADATATASQPASV